MQYETGGNDEQAMHYAGEALALDGENPSAMQTKGCVLMRRGDLNGALPLFILVDLQSPHAHHCRGSRRDGPRFRVKIHGNKIR